MPSEQELLEQITVLKGENEQIEREIAELDQIEKEVEEYHANK